MQVTRQLRNYIDESQDPKFTQTITLDLASVVTSVSGPKRPHDRVSVSDMKQDFQSCLVNPVSYLKKYISTYLFPYYEINKAQ